jgi:hypothetical protein
MGKLAAVSEIHTLWQKWSLAFWAMCHERSEELSKVIADRLETSRVELRQA